MSDESDNFEISDDEIDTKKHDKLVDDVLNLNKIQNVKKPSRTEPSLNVSEFNLVKSVTGDKGSIHLNALTNVLKGRKKHENIKKRLESTSRKSKTLPVPLEKPQADRIRRTLNYEKSRLRFDKWEALVTSNRVATQLTFPLNSVEKLRIEQKKSESYPSTWRLKSELETELEKLEPKVEEYVINNEEETFPLSLRDLKERRREAAKLRAHQSFKEAKARRQNKIKSKKYHRILRREKIKQSIKEFEELQKTNPEEALKKLEDIEKARAEERFSLRHKGTGQWAKNKQIRAKYDKESRQVLAQQLAISRELTQKIKNVDSDSEDEFRELEERQENDKVTDKDNPWVTEIKPSKEVADFVSSYRKYWNKQNRQESLQENDVDSTTAENGKETVGETNENLNEPELFKESENKTIKSKVKVKKVAVVKRDNKNKNKTKKRAHSLNKNDKTGTSDWSVSLLEDGNDIEDIFNKFEEKLKEKVINKLKKAKKPKRLKKSKKTTKESNKTKQIDLSLPTKAKKPVITEELVEKSGTNEEENSNDNPESNMNSIKQILEAHIESEKPSNINPQKFLEAKTTILSTAIPDILTTDENEESISQRDVLLEAFEDDDIPEDFRKEKENEIKKDTPADIDLNLPGWGSWGGTNIAPRKRKRFILKMPKKMPRRDDNKGSLIINEKAQSKVKPHMVSELPFPFKSVKDYEASIRAPIGNTFVPETAFRKLIEPSVVTKMGAIIEPINKSVLMGVKK